MLNIFKSYNSSSGQPGIGMYRVCIPDNVIAGTLLPIHLFPAVFFNSKGLAVNEEK